MASNDTPGGPPGAESTLDGFLAEIVGLARSVAPELALLLDPDERIPAAPWPGSRARGVRLCVSMLRYAREERASAVDAARLEAAIAFAGTELAALGERPADAPSGAELRARFDEIERELALPRARETPKRR